MHPSWVVPHRDGGRGRVLRWSRGQQALNPREFAWSDLVGQVIGVRLIHEEDWTDGPETVARLFAVRFERAGELTLIFEGIEPVTLPARSLCCVSGYVSY